MSSDQALFYHRPSLSWDGDDNVDKAQKFATEKVKVAILETRLQRGTRFGYCRVQNVCRFLALEFIQALSYYLI